MTITKDNCFKYVSRRFRYGDPIKTVEQQIKKLCRVVPEFTHEPILRVYQATDNGFDKIFLRFATFGSVFRFAPSWFGFYEDSLLEFESIEIDCESFGIKQATEQRIRKMSANSLL